ncbi:hypothetical protein AGMMS49960_19810 [Betaproteobacteria bacterium]|nr:hypothetical protein AGMMS49543_17060 [Betaproteobacteria bacterium]GHU04296.1 hypothetical protein AGMMS49960_19810 [Betaproteobacteria bacterium]GHU16681.1 hypothetical protein AGMMS50243_03400 [Betaproteobacteria bacterium]
MMRAKTIALYVVVLGVGIGLAACGSERDVSKRNFHRIIQAHLDGKDNAVCISGQSKKFPFEEERNSTSATRLKSLDALSYAGLLKRTETEVEKTSSKGKTRAVTVLSYDLTETGRQYHHEGPSGGFCFGKTRIQTVDLYTEPADAMGIKVARVYYTYKLEDVPDWVRSPALKNVEPTLIGNLDNHQKGVSVLVLTSDGWVPESEIK